MPRLIFGTEIIEPAAFAARVDKVAGWLAGSGIGPGDVVAYMLRNEPAILELGQAAQRLGATALPINWHFGAEETRYILSDSNARLLVAHGDLLQRLAPADLACPVYSVHTPDAICQAYGVAADLANGPPSIPSWREAVAAASPLPAPAQRPPGGATLMYTSGTTGKPKGVLRRAPTPDEAARIFTVLRQVFGTRPNQVLLTAAPLYHAAPSASTNAAMRVDGTVILLPRFKPEAFLGAIQQHRVTHAFMVPVMFTRLLRLPQDVRQKYDLSSLEWVLHGAAPCPPDLKRAMIEWWGPVIHEYYGSSEFGPIAACDSNEWLLRPGTVGRAVTGAEIAILDETGNPVLPGEAGEIFCRQTYYPDFTYHRLAYKRAEVDRSGLVTCGDVGLLDRDGFLFITDRKRDMVISGGVNIYPAEIEAVLGAMPGVADCAVFGIPDPEFGEAICAYIQPEPGATLERPFVETYLRERLAGYKLPRRIEFAESLPREESGKIFKRRLRDPFWENAGRRI
ncbi:AMP-binding protein [Ferrovibrio sp.]|uniref:AMP-binding protein n=1 Tax=Ferrovibrio sp. TaxID=1917215 RepID=UPI003D2A24C1